MTPINFKEVFQTLNDGNDPFPWQVALYERFLDPKQELPQSCNLPTGLGKTSVVAIWLIALARNPERIPRRLVYVVNRRTVVDQTTEEVEKLRRNLSAAGLDKPLSELCAVKTDCPLAISTLRGQFADNREWSADPARPAVIVGTVDMIGSRLLFSGYGVGFKGKPLHAGFLGQDVLLVHDEAHLEPAFQTLLVEIEAEQKRCNEYRAFRVMELSATPRGAGSPFELTQEEKTPPATIPDPPTKPIHVVWRRQKAKKAIYLHTTADEKKLGEQVADLALEKLKDSGQAIIVFLRRVDDVEKVVERLRKAKQHVQQLTGTLRGLERDQMADPRKETACPIFARFLKPPKPDANEEEKWKIEPETGTVYLVCTSAGEVGVNISADHLVCDLSTFDSMAQRFGRVNRFGDRDDTEIHVVHPDKFDEKDELDQRRAKTLDLLRTLDGDASPKALGELASNARREAFAPTPTILPVSDILFDSWALTTVRGELPGRPPVEPYLHGISGWEPPETHVAWREEVIVITKGLLETYKPEDLLEDYPLKPHELLRDNSTRVFDRLKKLAAPPDTPIWILSDDDSIEVTWLGKLLESDKEALDHKTLLLPPSAGGLMNGMLAPSSSVADDVADKWYDEAGRPRRARVWDIEPAPKEMRLIRTIDSKPEADDDEEESAGRRFWRWYERPASADGEGSRAAQRPVAWQDHTDDVTKNVAQLVQALSLSKELQQAITLAAKFHDLGKKRESWQRSIGNLNPKNWLAKSGGKMKPLELADYPYRHEFGSLLDTQIEPDFQKLSDDLKDLVLHLIAAHHGRGRPHFLLNEVFDPRSNGKSVGTLAVEVPQRFARLQRKYGRWGLAYLESLLRAADYEASANPSKFIDEGIEGQA